MAGAPGTVQGAGTSGAASVSPGVPHAKRARAPIPRARIYLMVLGDFGLAFAWVLKYAVTTPYFRQTLRGGPVVAHVVWALGPLSGLVAAPSVGVLSDRCTSRFGRRRPYIVAGLAASVMGMNAFAAAARIPSQPFALIVAVASFAVLDFAANVIMFPSRALMGDLVPADQQHDVQSAAAVVASFAEIVAGAYIYSWNAPVTHIGRLFFVASVVQVVSISVSVLVCREVPLDPADVPPLSHEIGGGSAGLDDGVEMRDAVKDGRLRGVRFQDEVDEPFDDVPILSDTEALGVPEDERASVGGSELVRSGAAGTDADADAGPGESSGSSGNGRGEFISRTAVDGSVFVVDDEEGDLEREPPPDQDAGDAVGATVDTPVERLLSQSIEDVEEEADDDEFVTITTMDELLDENGYIPGRSSSRPQLLSVSSSYAVSREVLTVVRSAIASFPRPLVSVGIVYFLAWACWFTCLPSYSVWIGETVLGGNPDADPGSREAKLYQTGVTVFAVANMVKATIALVFSAFYPVMVRFVGDLGERAVFGVPFIVFGLMLWHFAYTNSSFLAAFVVALGAIPFIATQTIPVAIAVAKFPENLASNLGILNLFCVSAQLFDTLYTGAVAQWAGEDAVMRIAAVWAVLSGLAAFVLL